MSAALHSRDQHSVLDLVRSALGRESAPAPAMLEPFIELEDQVDAEQLISRFTTEATAVMAQVHRSFGAAQLAEKVAEICANQSGEIAISGAEIFREIELPRALAERGLAIFGANEADHDILVARLANCSVGVTGAVYAIAETGTIVLSSDEPDAQLVSLLPPVHVAVIRSSQIVASLDQTIARLSKEQIGRGDPARSLSFITGPSRTGDVELVLSIGVHGPKESHVIIFEGK